jgi:nitroreductase
MVGSLESEPLLTLIKERRSIRDFKKNYRIKTGNIEKIIEAGKWAPSPTNIQPWKFITVTDKKICMSISTAVKTKIESSPSRLDFPQGYREEDYKKNFTFFSHASLLIFIAWRKILGFLNKSDHNKSSLIDESVLLSVGASIQNMLLYIHSCGLSACWLTGPMEAKKEIEYILNITPPWNLTSMIAVGKKNKKPAPHMTRKNNKFIWEKRGDGTNEQKD